MPRQRIDLSIAQLEQLLNKRRSRRIELEREHRKLRKQLDAIEQELNNIAGDARGRGQRARNEKSLTATIEDVLRRANQPMRVGDIADAALKSGYRTNSDNFRGIVNQTLIKEKQFTSAGRGLYQMKK
jgi:chromosome segregation ATPase